MSKEIIDWYIYLNKRVNVVLKDGTILNNKYVGIVSDEGDDEPESQFIGFADDRTAFSLQDIKSIEIIDNYNDRVVCPLGTKIIEETKEPSNVVCGGIPTKDLYKNLINKDKKKFKVVHTK